MFPVAPRGKIQWPRICLHHNSALSSSRRRSLFLPPWDSGLFHSVMLPSGGGGFLPFTVYTFHSLLFTSDSCLDLNHFKSHLRDICFSDIYLSTISLNYNYPLDIIPSISNRQISYKHLLVHIRTLWVDLELSENFSSTLAHPLSNHSPPSKQRTSLETKFR